MKFNWRRFLAFMPVCLGLAYLTVRGPHFMSPYAVQAIVVLLFATALVIFYRSSRWKPTLPRINARKSSLVFALVGVFFAAVALVEWRFPDFMPWLFVLTFTSVLVFSLLRRRSAPR